MRPISCIAAACTLALLVFAGCNGDEQTVEYYDGQDQSSTASSDPGSGTTCGPYTVTYKYHLSGPTLTISGLWAPGVDYTKTFTSSSSSLPHSSRPTGWTDTVSINNNGVSYGSHVLRYSSVTYSGIGAPRSFDLAIDGTYSCHVEME